MSEISGGIKSGSFGALTGAPSDNPALAAALAAAGTALSIRKTAWVETSANGGNDATGAVGNPAKPYATMQSAYNAGARVFLLGEGAFAGLTINSSDVSIALRGWGRALTVVTQISGDISSPGSWNIHDLGGQSVAIGTINYVPNTGGINGGTVVLNNALVNSINAYGVQADEFNSEPGGSGGTVVFRGICEVVASVDVSGGTGSLGDSEITSGNGGNGGQVLVEGYVRADSVSFNMDAGASGGEGGTDGGGGFLSVEGTLLCYNGSATLGGEPGGTVQCVGQMNLGVINLAGDGDITGVNIYITSIDSGSATIDAERSKIASTTYA